MPSIGPSEKEIDDMATEEDLAYDRARDAGRFDDWYMREAEAVAQSRKHMGVNDE